MDSLTLKDLTFALLWECRARGLVTAKTRLVKLLYIVELEFFRANQQRLTGTPWGFWHFGPYTEEIETVLEDPEIEIVTGLTSHDVDFKGVRLRQYEKLPKLQWRFEKYVKVTVAKWGAAPLEELLDYVYFDTEPMFGAKRGQLLQFDKVMPIERSIIPDGVRPTGKAMAQLRILQEGISSALKSIKVEVSGAYDDQYKKGVALWDDSPAPPTEGEVTSET